MQPVDFEVKFASYIKNHLGTFDRYYNEHWSLHFIINGFGSLQIDEERFDLAGSWFWAGYPGPRFRQDGGDPLPTGHYRGAFVGTQLDDWLHQGLWPQQPLHIHDITRMSECFEQVLRHQHGLTPLHNRLRAHAVEACLLEAWSQQEQAPQQELWLERCCQYLQEHACDEINYQHLAGKLFIPLPTLRRRFRRAMGMPMHRYAVEHRVHLAQQLLLSTDKSLQLVADELGYEDMGYFSRQFKKMTGLSPSAFRKERYY